MKYTPEQAILAFWSRVQKTETCWSWTGARWGNNNYGCTRLNGKSQNAHRVSWLLTNGLVPEGLKVLHRCDNPPCVRPDHLFLGTQKDNTADARAKGRLRNQHVDATHCKRGHEFTTDNTRHVGRGRQCRACDAIRSQRYRQ